MMSRLRKSKTKCTADETQFTGMEASTSSTKPETPDDVGSKEVKKRLEKFVEYFVKEFEATMCAYQLISENLIKIPGNTFAEKVGQGICGGIGGILGYFLGLPAAGANLGMEVWKVGGSELSSKRRKSRYKIKIANLSELMSYCQEQKSDFRKALVEAAYDIFQSFEMQFTRVYGDFGWKSAMQILAKDAVERAIANLSSGVNTSQSSISEVVLSGKSKIQPVLGVPVPTPRIKSPGYRIKYKHLSSKKKWNTASLYEKSGLVKDSDYCKKKMGKNKTRKYGYRRLLSCEDWNKLKDVSDDTAVKEFLDYTYTLPQENTEQWSQHINQLLDALNTVDESLSEERIREVMRKVQDSLFKEVEDWKQECKEHHEQQYTVLLKIEKNLKTLKLDEYVDSLKQYLKQRDQDVIQCLERGLQENTDNFIQINYKLDRLCEAKQNNEQVRKPIWFNVKQPVTSFAGREKDLEVLDAKIQLYRDGSVVSHITVVSGLGGIGKTELCRKYANDHKQDYGGNVVWIEAETRDTLRESFCDLAAEELGIAINQDRKESIPKSIIRKVYKYFAGGKSLFVFDNAESGDLLSDFLPLDLPPDSSIPTILITSRNQKWESGIEVIPLGEMKFAEAVKFIMRELNISEEDDSGHQEAKDLATKYQCYPLALQQAISYILYQAEQGQFGIRDYLKEFDIKAKDLLNFGGISGIDNKYDKTTYTTWKITSEKIGSDFPFGVLALEILNYLAYLNPDKIHRDLLGFVASPEQLRSAVYLLVKYSMVKSEEKQSVLSVHRLVQEVVRLELKEKCREREILSELMNGIMCLDSRGSTSTSKQILHGLNNHIMTICISAQKYKELHSESSSFVSVIDLSIQVHIRQLILMSGSKEALRICLLIMRVVGFKYLDKKAELRTLRTVPHLRTEFSKLLKLFKPSKLQKSHSQGCAQHKKHIKALKVYKETIIKSEANTTFDQSDALQILKRIAMTLLIPQKEYGEALEIYQAVLENEKIALEPDNPAILETMNRIASMHKEQGNYIEAMRTYVDVLEKRKKRDQANGIVHYQTLKTTKETVLTLLHLQKYRDALEICREHFHNGEANRFHIKSLLTHIPSVVGRSPDSEKALAHARMLVEFLQELATIPCFHEEMKPYLEEISRARESNAFDAAYSYLQKFSSDLRRDCGHGIKFEIRMTPEIPPKYPHLLTATTMFFAFLLNGYSAQRDIDDFEKYGYCDITVKHGLYLIHAFKQMVGPNYWKTLAAITELASCTEFIKLIKDLL